VLAQLRPLTEHADAVIAHNAFTLHFSLPLTAALWTIAANRRPGSTIAWCHDLSWTNPLYIPSMHNGYPWDLLRSPAPHTTYVTISAERGEELAELWEGGGPPIHVIPNGIAVESFLRLSPRTVEIVRRYDLFDRDAVLLLPVRITRRKNIELALPAVRVLKDRGMDVRFLISGPQAPHHPGRSTAYLDELKALRADLAIEQEVVFLTDELGERLDERTVGELFAICDLLLFPSGQEGFGLPILEAGLARMPVAASNLPIFREVGGADIATFDLAASADTIAGTILQRLDTGPARLFRRVLREHRWDALMDRVIVPLLESAGKD
jgi:glycosyltransferase involved in cell wall biosynthesis